MSSRILTYFSANVIAMPQYEHKSFEEVRLEDYMAGNKGTMEHAPLNANIDTESIEKVKDVLNSLEGEIPFKSALIPPCKMDEIRQVSSRILTYFPNIIAMPQYEHKSFEEVRLEDYMAGNKGTKEQAPLNVNTDTESIEKVKEVLDSLEGKIPTIG